MHYRSNAARTQSERPELYSRPRVHICVQLPTELKYHSPYDIHMNFVNGWFGG